MLLFLRRFSPVLAGQFLLLVCSGAAAVAARPAVQQAPHPSVKPAVVELMKSASAALQAGRYRNVVRDAQSALKLDPDFGAAWLFLGAGYAQMGELPKARTALLRAVKLEPRNADAVKTLAGVDLKLGNLSEAVSLFSELSTIRPNDPTAWDGLGWAARALSAVAIKNLEKENPDSPLLLILDGDREYGLERYQTAFCRYRKAAKHPGLRGVHEKLAAVYAATGHPDWAAIERAREGKLPPPNCTAHPFECLFAAGRYAEVIRAARSRRTAAAYYWTARAANALVQRVRRSLSKLPSSPQSHSWAARDYRDRELWKQTAAEWEQVLKFFPGNAKLEQLVTLSLFKANDFAAALPRLKKLRDRNPGSAQLSYYCGAALLGMRRVSEAEPYLRAALKQKPDYDLAHGALGRVYLELGRDREAIPHLQRALAIDTDGTFYYRLIRAYRNSGQADLARQTLERYRRIQRAAKKKEHDAGNGCAITAP